VRAGPKRWLCRGCALLSDRGPAERRSWCTGSPNPVRIARIVAAALWLAGVFQPARADSFLDGFRDPQDGKIDISDWLIRRKGFLPVPIVVTEPAVGLGGGVALMFVRNAGRESGGAAQGGPGTPPDIFVVGGVATENGTKAAFGGGMVSFGEDRWRYRGGIGRTDIRLQFYGIGGSLGGGEHSIGYALDGWTSNQQLLRRLGDSETWLGARWVYLDLDSRANLAGDPNAGLQPADSAQRASGLGLMLEHDSRDNIFTPSRGWSGALEATFYDPAWGSGSRFQTYRGRVFSYWPATPDLVVAGRIDGRSANGDTPFYMLPFIDLRGVRAARYQEEHTAVVETELRYNVTPRWGAIGFVGAGRAWGRKSDFGDTSTVVGKGVGVRYLIARQLGMWMGLDFALGPEGSVVYLQVGSAWR
jgi:hypothetical protein